MEWQKKQFKENLHKDGCGYSSICEDYSKFCPCGVNQNKYDGNAWRQITYDSYSKWREEEFDYRY